MSNNHTLCLIKPCAVSRNLIGKILTIIEENGYQIIELQMHFLSFDEAKKFYIVHQNKEFYEGLCSFISSAPSVIAILKKENAIEDFRILIGKTDPLLAEKGTIRQMFGISSRQNAIHGSDSVGSFNYESSLFFDKSFS